MLDCHSMEILFLVTSRKKKAGLIFALIPASKWLFGKAQHMGKYFI
jgi:hypothetical protein